MASEASILSEEERQDGTAITFNRHDLIRIAVDSNEREVRQQDLLQVISVSRDTFHRHHTQLRLYCHSYREHYRKQRTQKRKLWYTPFMQWCHRLLNALYNYKSCGRVTVAKITEFLKSPQGKQIFSEEAFNYALHQITIEPRMEYSN
jgi:hypothetical protein